VIISGAVLVAMLFALITDRLLTLRLDYVLGKRGVPRMENHIVLVGLGQVGWRIFENLQQFSVPVVCIEAKQQSHHIDLARRVGATVIVDDARHSHVLENANVAKARSIICATDNDLVNLEVALDARELNPQIRVILRMYEQSLARKVTQGFDIQNAFSSSALAAPAFACAAIDDMIVNSFFLDSVQVVTLRLEVQAGSPATRMKRFELTQAYPCALLKHKHGAGQVEIHPRHDHPITAGDVLLINCALDQIGSIKQAVGYVAR
jgi:Trk K+ transport system NAD-binding subunit